jgi:hypothetical protein
MLLTTSVPDGVFCARSAAAALLVPVRRATRVDPISTLR